MAGRNNLIGSATAGNTISGNGQDGLYVQGVRPMAHQAQGDQISGNTGNGVTLVTALGVTIGGSSTGAGNQIVNNQGYGVYASGVSSGTVVQQNVIAANSAGNVNLTNSSGITYIP